MNDDAVDREGIDAVSPWHWARLRQHDAAGHCSTNVRQNLIIIIVIIIITSDNNVQATSAKQAKFVVLRAFTKRQVNALQFYVRSTVLTVHECYMNYKPTCKFLNSVHVCIWKGELQ